LVQSHNLYEIDRQHQPSIQQVAEALGTDITTFSRQVQSLIKMNLVKKLPDPDDRRCMCFRSRQKGNMWPRRLTSK
jgi:DNA-binding MarR family transcriptional regulator